MCRSLIITEMNIMTTLKRKPTSPGEILKEEFLIPMGLTQKQLADHLGCDVKVINRLVNERSSLTVPLAFKLAAAFKTTPEFWLNAQRAVDLYTTEREVAPLPKPLTASKVRGSRAA